MDTIGSHEAKTRFPQLLERVAEGEKILITKHGKPVAMLVPAECAAQPDLRQTISAMKALRRGNRLGAGRSLRDLIEEGRRH